jgi:transcriptional regulator with XRE-family HTH domain
MQSTVTTLRELLAQRGLSLDAAAVLAGVDTSTISRIVNGRNRARPETIVRLSRGLGISARRGQGICEASWRAAHPPSSAEPSPGRQETPSPKGNDHGFVQAGPNWR